MTKQPKDPKSENSEIKKENQDLPNIPAASEKINPGEGAEKQIKKTSHLQKDGKTDNTEKNPQQ